MTVKEQAISLKTAIPGPKTKELLEKRKQYVPNGVGNNTPIFAKKASGACIEDVDGNVFLDFAGAIGTINAGHSPQAVVDAVKAQADQFLHTCFHVAMYEPYVDLAEKLCAITPGNFTKKAIFLNSGAEAVENAVKIARKYTGRTGIVSFTRAFHGRTLLGMSLTSKVKPYKFQMGPFAPATYKAPFPYLLHKPSGLSDEQYANFLIQQFEDFLYTEVAPEEVAAVIMEPVQGEGGFIVPPKTFVQAVARICKQHGIIFIADEIQTGFARTGKMFASEHFELEPDIITLSKSLAAGVPISAVVGRSEIMDAPSPGEIGGTYGGSPLGCVAALEVIKLMEENNLSDRAAVIGNRIQVYFTDLQKEIPYIAEIRGLGAMIGIEFLHDETKAPLKEFVAKVAKDCYEKGVILLSAGVHGNVLRFLSPLIITDEQLEEGLGVIGSIIKDVYRSEKK
ncbi:MAG: 4-aminobutyrate--2-oxoglutarate transaminase [Bacillaceae bacterium]